MQPYNDDVTINDKISSDQLEVVCECGRKSGPAWGLWPQQMKRAPLRQVAERMTCRQCGRRSPTIRINGYGQGGQMRELWRWPKA
ncbi:MULTISPECIES: hypothetical protein [unclassified Brevundimonas]|uniref:hypothetical protein n=1 Tax=unclassified Brevundimonas TaxID=2622653 RepID=UPI0025BFDE16|nr:MULTISPECIES: hypothetical protein [unclassified Brevundimonas]